MKRWWRDTLFKRLFVLMWVALVASHLVAYLAVTRWVLPAPDGRGPGILLPDGPPLPSLPPTPGLPGPGAGPEWPGPDAPGPRPEWRPADASEGGPALPAGALLLDYGLRFLIIGAAAWWGARWLAAPMRRLVRAAHALSSSIGRNEALPALDERGGTLEVRETAQVFNDMARQLDAQFKGRGLLVAAISHDLRTPLTRIRVRLESLAHEPARPPEGLIPECAARRYSNEPAAQRCIADVREMNELIDSVLEVFRGDGVAEPARSTDVFALVQALADDLVEQGHAVTAGGTAATAQVQLSALRRALANLLSNAVRYGERADVKVFREAGGVKVVIDDEGPGIPPAQLEAVFEPFYRVESSRNRRTGGTGLGLYIARDLVQRQRGSLTLTNRPEGGLRATVFLPSGPR